MTTSQHVNVLFDDLFETSQKIGVMEDYTQKVSRAELPDIPTDLTRSAAELYTRRFQLERQIKEAIEMQERSKTRFQRLFNR